MGKDQFILKNKYGEFHRDYDLIWWLAEIWRQMKKRKSTLLEINTGLVEEARRYPLNNSPFGVSDEHKQKASLQMEEAMSVIIENMRRELIAT